MPLLEGIKRSINTRKKRQQEEREFKEKMHYETREAERQAYREAYRKAALKRARAKGSAKATGKGFGGLNFGSVAKAGKQFAVNMQSTFGDDLGQRKGKHQKPWWED